MADREVRVRTRQDGKQAEVAGVPDLHRLWMVAGRVEMSQVGQLCGEVVWRMAVNDWLAIQRTRVESPTGPVIGWDGERHTLFGVPVVVVNAAWPCPVPELVLVVDHRVWGKSDAGGR